MHISSRRLGDFLVARRVLSRDSLDELLAREASEGTHLSHLLVEERLVGEHDLTAAVANELRVPFVDLADRSILADVWGLVPEDLARGYLAVAIERTPDGVLVAMQDPGDDAVVKALEQELASPILPAVATADDLLHLVEQIYGPADGAPATDDAAWPADDAPAPVDTPRPGGGRAALEDLLDAVLQAGASDLHLTVGAPPTLRIGGALQPMERGPLIGSEVRRLVLGLLNDRQRQRLLDEGELETSHALPGRGRFRVSAFIQRDSLGAVIRVVPVAPPDAASLGLPPEVVRWADHTRGLVLICGPHGAGTSTTLAALVDRINRRRACHILTLEDPIEFLHRHDKAIVNQREVGEDTASFAVGMRHALRQDPDVLLVGELPDPETLALALGAAETGQLVLATLRTVGAVQTLQRIVDVFPPDMQQQVRVQLAMSLRGIAVQQLVPTVDGGRTLAAEVIVPIASITQAIREGDNATLAKVIVGGAESGMRTMDQALATLVQTRRVRPEVALEHAVDQAELRYLLGE